MKQIIVFAGLKVGEVLGVAFIPFLIGKFLCGFEIINSFFECPDHPVVFWVVGFLSLFGTFAVCFLTWAVVVTNWEWAEKLCETGDK